MSDSGSVANEVLQELARARKTFPPFNSAHEGYAVILEEVEELKAEVFWKKGEERKRLARAEAIQVAAMAIRFILDVTDKVQDER